MAIPISMPSSENVEDNCSSLEILLEELLVTLREVVVQLRREQAVSRTVRQRTPTSHPQQTASRVPTPTPTQYPVPVATVVAAPSTSTPISTTTSTQTHPRQQHQHQHPRPQQQQQQQQHHPRLPLPDVVADIECSVPRPRKFSVDQSAPLSDDSVSTWVHAGAQLRHIADSFHAERAHHYDSIDGKRVRHKEENLLSHLCPDFGRSIWTTVALLVGWGIFSRSR